MSVWDNHEIKLFKIKLSDFESGIDRFLASLTTEEIERANRYHFKKDRDRFIICRALLRILLSEKTNQEVSEITIGKNENKKPYLLSHPSVFFNVSHTDDYALIVIADSLVGVDVEKINPSFNYHEILHQVFTETEINELLDSEHPLKTFYVYWTRKEAILKAIGTGINDSIKKICSIDGMHECFLGTSKSIKRLKASTFEFDHGYIGTLACSSCDINPNSVPCVELYLNSSILIEKLRG